MRRRDATQQEYVITSEWRIHPKGLPGEISVSEVRRIVGRADLAVL
ncbi:MAG: hypothetical protein ACJAYU_003807 [Bradymonadia bacterium]|jgi:hypothetical protein